MEVLSKHIKYYNSYSPNILYWGLGIENELYLEFTNTYSIKKNTFLKNHKRERYSIDYYTNYNMILLKEAFEYIENTILKNETNIMIPILMNCHSFTRTDKNNNSMTLYTKLCETNPKFSGIVLTDYVFKNSTYINDNYNKNFIYEGDVIEIITLEFFNTTLDCVIKELEESKAKFIHNLQDVFSKNNIFIEYGIVNYMKENYPFAIYLTNINNISMFNNGTLHFNITLPTLLNNTSIIQDNTKFIKEHMNYIRYIQYIEPLLLCMYGTPDPFSYIKMKNFKNSMMFSSCSQRCAISRYIGLGTYDTDTMIPGKLLTSPINTFKIATEDYGWYNKYYKNCAYTKLDELGYDINFNKHYNHGIEIRFFDHISDINNINKVLEFLIYLGDFSLNSNTISNPINDIEWNNIIIDCMRYGSELELNKYIEMYNKIFNYMFTSKTICDLYEEMYQMLKTKSKENNMFSKYIMNDRNINMEYCYI